MPVQTQFPMKSMNRHLVFHDLRYWSIITAYGLAAAEQLKLTPAHLNMLEWLRQDYFQHGVTPIIRLVLRIENAFSRQGGVFQLLSLFPKGPLQALKIAGLPIQRKAANHVVSMH